MKKIFLEAEWRKLVIANYAVDVNLLKSYLPPKTEIDLWNNTCYVSLVGFKFENTKVMGFKIPWHTDFEEVNLRFYVRYKDKEEWKRGVCFIKEIVPRPALSWVANTVYQEHYETLPMKHSWNLHEDKLTVSYAWKKHRWHSLEITTTETPYPIEAHSEEEFITEHFWGYTKLSNETTSEYGVEHPRWEVYKTLDFDVDVDFQQVYGNEFGFLSQERPTSVFLAEGSAITVKKGIII